MGARTGEALRRFAIEALPETQTVVFRPAYPALGTRG
jgi:hypothetical protein